MGTPSPGRPQLTRWLGALFIASMASGLLAGCSNLPKESGEAKYPAPGTASIALAKDDAEKGCKRLPKSERLEYCLRYLAGEISVKGDDNSKSKRKTRVNANADAKYAFKYFNGKRRMSCARAAGIVGNLIAESGVNPSEGNPAASGGGGGIAQWEGGRWSGKTGLLKYAKSHSTNWDNMDIQLDFIWWEFHNSPREKIAWEKLNASSVNTPEEAADVVRTEYERPDPNPQTDQRERRRNLAGNFC